LDPHGTISKSPKETAMEALEMSAHAWGEPVPKTEAAARRVAAKGRRLLERYERTKRAPLMTIPHAPA
jgi:hypothetical protein